MRDDIPTLFDALIDLRAASHLHSHEEVSGVVRAYEELHRDKEKAPLETKLFRLVNEWLELAHMEIMKPDSSIKRTNTLVECANSLVEAMQLTKDK